MPDRHDHHASPDHHGPHGHTHATPKVQLVGTVAGVDACHVLTDGESLTAGSALDCDLIIADPLTPRRAFRLREVKDHHERRSDCDSGWVLEALPGARVFVNNCLAKRERLSFGDTIATGCHKFSFLNWEANERDRRGNVDVEDLCRDLVKSEPVPLGFLQGCVSWRDRMRRRKAVIPGAVAALLALLLIFLLAEPEKIFEQVQEPLEIQMLSEQMAMPAAESVRSLEDVKRQTHETPEGSGQPTQLTDQAPTPINDMQARTLAMKSDPLEAAAPSDVRRVMDDATPNLAPLAVATPTMAKLEVQRDAGRLGQTAPVRRLTRDEATNPMVQATLGYAEAKSMKDMPRASTSTTYSTQAAQQRTAPPPAKLDQGRAETLAELRYKASPLNTEVFMGAKIPVVRMAESLTTLSVPDAAKGYSLDGEVSDSEMSMSWKSGRFKRHAPGTPPEADPATYCYVGKTEVNGRHYLYISFVCMDPNVGALVTSYTGNPNAYRIEKDDSVEIFLDTTNQRGAYYQMIVNARGQYWAQWAPNAHKGINGEGSAWNVDPQIKTTINRQAGRWTGEILIPFDKVGGVPSKGTRWAVNFTRNFRGQTNPGGYQNWFLVYERDVNYHHPRLFGVFEW